VFLLGIFRRAPRPCALFLPLKKFKKNLLVIYDTSSIGIREPPKVS
jgi:hypothetical protein